MKVIVDYRISHQTERALINSGCEVIKTLPLKSVYHEICGHPDIQLHNACGRLICASETYDYYRKLLPETDIIRGSVELGAKYPYDIAYNTCRIGRYALCRREYTAPEILMEYEKNNIEIIDIKQGYAKCSICVVTDNAVITADKGICRALTGLDIDVLEIQPGYIELYGMDGFIGGASGLIKRGILAFNGSLFSHPDGERIDEFVKSHGVMSIMLDDRKLQDIGSIIRIDDEET